MRRLPSTRVGEKYLTNEGYWIEIVQCFSIKNCTIKFLYNDILLHGVSHACIERGNVKNPYHLSVYGVGYLGIGKYSPKSHPLVYKRWSGMFRRCYSANNMARNPTYKNCSVSKEWHNFQNFAEWYENNWKSHMDSSWHLDKDILQENNKIYSPETCCFVPHEINMAFTGNNKRGVYKYYKRYVSYIGIKGKFVFLGSYKTYNEAWVVFKERKEIYIRDLAYEWKNKLDYKIYNRMINYKFIEA